MGSVCCQRSSRTEPRTILELLPCKVQSAVKGAVVLNGRSFQFVGETRFSLLSKEQSY